ncbi:hypothetical protein B0T16DRAFT_386402 [Cercophora newfieldiana]|uniref:Uncharacterized protein n=1 Tax=Cercophora newfieldiana TaxID=92897 RepID=A0AA39YUX8_9PEZI|nr:hypothetical protein B0T16DRAFT_386402 [Cercophora newfieldiana]
MSTNNTPTFSSIPQSTAARITSYSFEREPVPSTPENTNTANLPREELLFELQILRSRLAAYEANAQSLLEKLSTLDGSMSLLEPHLAPESSPSPSPSQTWSADAFHQHVALQHATAHTKRYGPDVVLLTETLSTQLDVLNDRVVSAAIKAHRQTCTQQHGRGAEFWSRCEFKPVISAFEELPQAANGLHHFTNLLNPEIEKLYYERLDALVAEQVNAIEVEKSWD